MNAIPENKAVGMLSELLALECGYSPAKARQIRIAAVLHDCGKMYIPEQIINKPDKLNAHEKEIMKTHTMLGFNILSSLSGELGDWAKIIALYHHEWANRQGYWGVPSAALPKFVRIVSLCDVLVALLYNRVYKPSWPPLEALDYIKSMAGIQFCPEITDIFITLVQKDDRVAAIFKEVSH
jgi:putative two-component system response regulator